MKIATARQLVQFTAEQIRLHYGPGPHADGSPQSVHGGGTGQQAGHDALQKRTEFQKRPWQVGSGRYEPKDAPQPTRGLKHKASAKPPATRPANARRTAPKKQA